VFVRNVDRDFKLSTRRYISLDVRFLGSTARPVRRADNLAAICEPIV
jgi:hypothetical protein